MIDSRPLDPFLPPLPHNALKAQSSSPRPVVVGHDEALRGRNPVYSHYMLVQASAKPVLGFGFVADFASKVAVLDQIGQVVMAA